MPRLSTPQNQMKTGLLRPSVRSLNLLLLFLHRARKPSLALHLFSQITSNSILVHPYAHSLVTRTLLQSGRFQEAKRFIFRAESDFGFTPKSSLFESLIHGLCVAEQNPDEALAILQECIQHHNFCPSVGIYRAVVSAFGSQGRFDRAVQILEAIGDEKNLFLTDNFICSSIISGFSRNGVPALGLEFYERAKVAGLDPNLVTFTTVVDALCREGRIDEACNLVRKMEDNGMVLDVVLYTCLIDGYMKRGEIMEGLRKHKFMMETGINPDAVSYTSIIDGLCKEGSVEKVIGFLTEMENHDIQPNLVTYTTIIRGFCLRNKLEEALCLLRKAEELSFVADEFLYSIMIDGFCRRGDLDGAFNMLEKMEKKEIKVGSVTYNTVINSLCKIGQINKANEISNGFVNDNFTYSILLHGYLKETNVGGILEVKRKLDESGVICDIVTCNVLIKSFFMVGMVEDACKLFNELPSMGLVPNSITYSTVIDGYFKEGLVEKALMLFNEYQRNSTFTSSSIHDYMIKGLCRHGMTKAAIKVFEDLVEKSVFPDATTCRMLIQTIFSEGNGDSLWRFVHRVENIDPELLSLICNDVVLFLCKKGHFPIALNVYMLLRMKYLPVKSKSYDVLLEGLSRIGDEHTAEIIMGEFIKQYGTFASDRSSAIFLYLCKKSVDKAIHFLKFKSRRILATTIESLKKKGRIEDAYKFLLQSEENGVSLDLFVYSIVVDGLCKSGYLEKALDLCATMKKKGVHPNIVIYNSVINGLCQQGCLTEAFRVFDSLEKLIIPPTIVTYSTLIGALSRQGFLDDASKLLKRMINKGVIPNTYVYNKLINGYCSFGLVDKAMELLSDLEKSCLNPDAFTIASIMSGYCQQGDVESCLSFFIQCKSRGHFPDFLGFMSLIKGFFAKGRQEEARGMLREMLKSEEITKLINAAGNELHLESLQNLLSVACEQGKIEEVIPILNEISCMFFSSTRFNGHRMFTKLNKLHDSDMLDMKAEKTEGTHIHHPESNRESRPEHELSLKFNIDKDKEAHEYQIVKPQGYDFATYYSTISSLCRRGDLQKANIAIRAMLQDKKKSSVSHLGLFD
ncbi:pentatricopeptide repeat-containing protein At5g57250, mitochondrial-like isoform X1 [Zingiber officinale]|uniref:pentatricopeptide repeat-containing protein At5g57250, mitochondrial-like isoform X1 n=1 Tax=Zingiber officinale TaxID=94328 RepID=UPI001C4BDDE1|nr:pentatricopeptide repeat-containing protein At5g57250, mitochondrial-like isoform X1 [Zingiber officinale]XP_042377581.1 pentatricopeptide repeat-containing protein At5g57250, mitochondrial-like isoform X1 [Zingiber officinale]XP_042377582.1 pentatricopeptide repeat-containing protein At5g57250, mitochondrial-like isoform X1 [Zingiber officinale]XP_042377583.1 pentatricopeptide repeat-containing protein At5g57250, mitochondrial-like isoform X1 [Zingiber officinale]